MINLAGVETCDKVIETELKTAGIEIVSVGQMNSEVPASIIGVCNSFIFKRAWYYWVVTGYMPLETAKEMYKKYKDLSIRVAGHCGNPPPEEWCQPKYYEELCKPLVDKLYSNEITYDEFNAKCTEIRKQGEQFITHYHIDTQEGLNRFVEMIKNNNVIGYKGGK